MELKRRDVTFLVQISRIEAPGIMAFEAGRTNLEISIGSWDTLW